MTTGSVMWWIVWAGTGVLIAAALVGAVRLLQLRARIDRDYERMSIWAKEEAQLRDWMRSVEKCRQFRTPQHLEAALNPPTGLTQFPDPEIPDDLIELDGLEGPDPDWDALEAEMDPWHPSYTETDDQEDPT